MIAIWLAALTGATASPAEASALRSPAPAASGTIPATAPSADPLAYDDPAVHFRPPDGWVRVKLGNADPGSNDRQPPSAVYLFHAGQSDQRTIVLDIQPFVGSLEGFVSSHETELRNAAEGTFVDKRLKVTLGNGMPAYFLKVTQPGGQAGHQMRRFDYVTYDLKRSISVAYVGRYGDFDDAEAQKALASLYVVVYPRDRQ